MSTRREPGRRPAGIALLAVLAVVILITTYITEYFFASGLELRAMQTFKEAQQARNLAKSAFKAVQMGLLMDEPQFFDGYGQLQSLLSLASVPFEDGLLVELSVEPQDHLFNLNQMFNLQGGQAEDQARYLWFSKVLGTIEIPPEDPDFGEAAPPDAETTAALYAAIMDWLDADLEGYNEFSGIPGAEGDAYFTTEPNYDIKNGLFDRLEELRLIRGVVESRIPWRELEARFTVRPKQAESFFYPEHLNINLASREQIAEFMEQHSVEEAEMRSWTPSSRDIQRQVNEYYENLETILEIIVPESGQRPVFTMKTLKKALKEADLNENYAKRLFTTYNQYYRVRLMTEVERARTRLDAMLRVPRSESTRTGRGVQILHMVLQ